MQEEVLARKPGGSMNPATGMFLVDQGKLSFATHSKVQEATTLLVVDLLGTQFGRFFLSVTQH